MSDKLKTNCWPSYVCPTILVRDCIQAQIPNIQSDYHLDRLDRKNKMTSWKVLLCERARNINGNALFTNQRALKSILDLKTRVVYTSVVDEFLMAVELRLDFDIQLPILPGNKKYAIDLLTIRGEMEGVKDIEHYVPRLLELSNEIIDDPYNASIYQDQAPFDCLRPPRTVLD